MDRGQSVSDYIALSGEYDLARKAELVRCFASISSGRQVTIDMRDVTYVDSTFLNELTALRLRLEEKPVTLVGVRPNIARLLGLAKLDRFFIFSE
jgi:anti-anti-sigma factor